MNYKIASKLCSILCTIGVLLLTMLLIIRTVNTLFIICAGMGVVFISIGFGVKALFFRCPNCGKRLPLKSEGGHCPNWGKMLH